MQIQVRRLAGILMLAVLSVEPADGSTVRLRFLRNQLVVVSVRVNGQGPFDFLLDTGSTTTLADLGLARELELTPEDRSIVTSISGRRAVPRARLDSLAVGTQVRTDLPVLCADIEGIRSLDRRVRGVLGYDFLSRFSYVLSYRKRMLQLEDDYAFEDRVVGTRLDFDPAAGRLILGVNRGGKQPVRLVLDTGAVGLVLFLSPEGKLELEVARNAGRPAKVSSSTASHFLRTGWVRRFEIGDQTFRDIPVSLVRSKDAVEGRTEDGLLPARMFESFYFNHRSSFVVLNPKYP